MSKSLVVFTVAVVFLCLGTSSPADDGWKFPSINPFKSEPTRSSARPSNSSSWWGMPKLPGFSSTPTGRPGTKKPSMVSKMTRSTKSAMSKTYDVLTPWDNSKPRKPTTQMRNSNSESQGGFFGWFSPKEEPKIQTVNDWLNQPRP